MQRRNTTATTQREIGFPVPGAYCSKDPQVRRREGGHLAAQILSWAEYVYSGKKWVRFIKSGTTNETANTLRGLITDKAKPEKKILGTKRADAGKEFPGEFQGLLTEHWIRHEVTAPGTPHFNRVAERALELLSEKAIALLKTLQDTNDNIQLAKAIDFAFTVGNLCVLVSIANNGGTSPHRKWSGSLRNVKSFIPLERLGISERRSETEG